VILEPSLEPGLPAIEADSAQIQQVIMNLITNASESIAEGESGTISFSTHVCQCDLEYLAKSCLDEKPAPGKYVFLEVKDTGCGMDEKTKGTLFDPFFTTKFTGRGLGMAAVLGIVRGHGGAIMVESQPGLGTTFRVLFPALAMDAKALKTKGEKAKRDQWRGTGTVLVVDDETSVLEIVSRMVERLGFKILTAADGQEAVEVFREHADEITCVLIDLTMPRMDGGEACLEIQKIRRDAVIILSSGYNESELSERFDGYDFAGFVPKPYKMKDLRKIMQEVLLDKPEF
jgi:two-component system cell cycle sensor histidine kinase/response regulator CckA